MEETKALNVGNVLLFACSKCLFVYGPLCHGAFKLDLSTLFTTHLKKKLFNLYSNIYIYYNVTKFVILINKLRAFHITMLDIC